jgi:hypothetical protein
MDLDAMVDFNEGPEADPPGGLEFEFMIAFSPL